MTVAVAWKATATVVISLQVRTLLLGRGRGRSRKSALPSLGGVGGGYLLNSFTKAFARQAVLRSKSIAVENTRVLSEFAMR